MDGPFEFTFPDSPALLELGVESNLPVRVKAVWKDEILRGGTAGFGIAPGRPRPGVEAGAAAAVSSTAAGVGDDCGTPGFFVAATG